jgi:hypothetical protein
LFKYCLTIIVYLFIVNHYCLSFLCQPLLFIFLLLTIIIDLIIWHAVQFVVPNIDQMYKEMKKIVEVGNKHGNGEKFPDFGDLFYCWPLLLILSLSTIIIDPFIVDHYCLSFYCWPLLFYLFSVDHYCLSWNEENCWSRKQTRKRREISGFWRSIFFLA